MHVPRLRTVGTGVFALVLITVPIYADPPRQDDKKAVVQLPFQCARF